VFFEWKYHTSGFLGREIQLTASPLRSLLPNLIPAVTLDFWGKMHTEFMADFKRLSNSPYNPHGSALELRNSDGEMM
jgi:hypothetical protein